MTIYRDRRTPDSESLATLRTASRNQLRQEWPIDLARSARVGIQLWAAVPGNGKRSFQSGDRGIVEGFSHSTASGVLPMLPATRMWVSRLLVHPSSSSLGCGVAAGTAWVAMCASYWSAFEPVPAARVTFALAWALTLAMMWSPRVVELLARMPHFWRVVVASCGLAIWPTVWKFLLARREAIPLDWFAGEWTSLAAMSIPAVLLIMPAVVWGCVLCPAPSVDSQRMLSGPKVMFWLGVALSWGVLPTTLFVRVGADQVLLSVSACFLLGAGLSLFVRGAAGEDLETSMIGLARKLPAQVPVSAGTMIVSLLAALLLGAGLEAANRTAEQLVLESLPLKLFGWAGFLLGALASLAVSQPDTDPRRGVRRSLLLIASASAAVLVLFPVWIRLGIWSSSSLSSMPSIVLAKGAILVGILCPFGCAAGALWGSSSRRSLLIGSIGIGYALHTVFAGTLAGTQWAVACAAVGLCLGLWPLDAWKQLVQDRGRNRHAAALATCGCIVAVACGCHGWLNPARSAGLLFNGEAFAAAGRGHDLLTIERADRTRLLQTIEGKNGVWTIWRPHSNQLMVRRNGVPTGQMSIDTAFGPQNFWSVMAAAVPLVFHPQADDVLCLGTPGLVELNTLLGFPVHSLTCVEADREAHSILEYEASITEGTSRLQDGRIEWVSATPMQYAASSVNRTYDVIVCPEASAVPMRAQPRLTQEFHRRMALHLNSTGLFCQRMNIIDFGTAPLVDTLRSLRSAFDQTCVVTTEGSEILLLASNSPEPLIGPGIVARMETPQVRQLCATLGGDWSMLAQLACMPTEHVDQVIAESKGTSNGCRNARFVMNLGAETLRWGPKWKEKQALFANRMEIMLAALGLEEKAKQTIGRRILDSQERTRILTERADDQWSYRRVLKDALKDRPRTTIQRVNHEIRQTLSIDDKHRKSYLTALGKAAREAVPALSAIERIEGFSEPYDPLVTDFVHFEVAHLLGRAEAADPARQYRHWMYCIAYAPSADHSVRPVAAALDLLRQNPEIMDDPAERWDQFSSLLNVMRIRWTGRWQAQAPSKFEAADMQHSIESVTATLGAMNDLREAAGIDRETWKVQRRIWEDSLVNPTHARQSSGEPKNQMLETVRQEWQRRNSELAEPK